MLRLSCLPNQLCFKIRKACLPFNMKLIYNFSTDAQSQQPERAKQNPDQLTLKPSVYQKFLLVVGRTYPSFSQIPERVTASQMKRAGDKFIPIYTFVCTIVGIFIMIIYVSRKSKQMHEDFVLHHGSSPNDDEN